MMCETNKKLFVRYTITVDVYETKKKRSDMMQRRTVTLSVIGCDENVLKNVNWIKSLISRSERIPHAGSYGFLSKIMVSVLSNMKLHIITHPRVTNHDALLTSENP